MEVAVTVRNSTAEDGYLALLRAIFNTGRISTGEPLTPQRAAGLHDKLERALKTITEREEQVLKMRFGLSGGKCLTQQAIGKTFGVSRSRINNIQGRALKKLRHPCRMGGGR